VQHTRIRVRARVSARVDGRRVARTARGARARDADQGLARAVKVGRRGPFATTGAREDALERRWMRGEGVFLIARARARGDSSVARARVGACASIGRVWFLGFVSEARVARWARGARRATARAGWNVR